MIMECKFKYNIF